MEAKGTTQIQRQPITVMSQQSTRLQRGCACGQHTVAGGECEACRKNRESGGAHAAVVPFSNPHPLTNTTDDSAEQTSPPDESHFAYDFSQIAVHIPATHTPAIQTKLEVNEPRDEFEQEADEIAEQVTQHPGLERESRRRSVLPLPITHTNGDMLHALKQKPAMPLSQHVRQRVEPLFGVDLGYVRVHADSTANEAAKALRAKAFTHHNHIWLGANQNAESLALMAHEATHVVQQSASPTLQSAVQRKDDASTEDEQPTEDRTEERKKAQQKTLETLQQDTETAPPARSLVSSDAPQPISPEAQKAVAQDSSSTQAKAGQRVHQSANVVTSSLRTEIGQNTTPPTNAQGKKQVEQTKDKHTFVATVAPQTLEKPALVTNSANTIQQPTSTRATAVVPRPVSSSLTTSITNSSQGVQDSNLTETASSTTKGLAASSQRVSPARTPNSVAGIPQIMTTTEEVGTGKEANEKQQKETTDGATTTGPGVGAPSEGVPRGNAIRPYLPKREPTFEEFFTMLEAGHTIEQDRMEAHRRLAVLQAEAEQEKTAILQAAEMQKTQITTDVEAHTTSAQTTMKTQTDAIHTHFATTRSALRSSIAQEKKALEKQVATEIDKIEGKNGIATKNSDEFEKQLLDRQKGMTKFAEDESKQPPIIAKEGGERATKELEKTALEAEKVGENEAKRYPGEEDPKPAQRQAAHELANQSAADIREKKAPLMDDMRTRADNFTGNYMDYAKTVKGRITEAGTTTTPALKDLASNAIKALRDSKTATFKFLDDRLRVDLQALHTAEAQAVTRIKTSSEQTIRELRANSTSATHEVNTAATALTKKIDDNVQEVSEIIDGEEQPFLPGIIDVIIATQANMTEVGKAGTEQLNVAVSSVAQIHSKTVDAFTQQVDTLVASTNKGADRLKKNTQGAVSKVLQARTKQAEEVIQGVDTQQKSMVGAVLTEVDKAAEEAKGKIREINTKFRSDLREAADKSVEEGKKPRVDLEKRVHDAAEEAGEAWYIGLLKAVGEILVGLIVVIAIALLIAGIAAFFGVFLTAWTAIMLAGALLLAIGLILSTIGRYQQLSATEGGGLATFGKALGLGVIDTVGITGIIESYTGKDVLTGKRLSSGERTRRGVTGVVSLVMIALGVRGAIKGPPGGLYTRSTGMPRSWPGFSEGLARAWRGVKTEQGESIGGIRNLALEVYNGVRENISDINKWIRERVGGDASKTTDTTGTTDATKNTDTTDTSKTTEQPTDTTDTDDATVKKGNVPPDWPKDVDYSQVNRAFDDPAELNKLSAEQRAAAADYFIRKGAEAHALKLARNNLALGEQLEAFNRARADYMRNGSNKPFTNNFPRWLAEQGGSTGRGGPSGGSLPSTPPMESPIEPKGSSTRPTEQAPPKTEGRAEPQTSRPTEESSTEVKTSDELVSQEPKKTAVSEEETSHQSETEQQQTSQPQGQKDAYTTAKEGGKHSGWYEQYKIKDTSEVQRGIRSLEKQIQEHQDKIAHPKKYIADFDRLPPQQQKALVEKKWPSDVRRQSEQKAILEGILKDRREK